MKDLGEPKFFLGIEFSKSKRGIHMCQRKYTLELVFELGVSSGKPTSTPMEFNHKLTSVEFDKIVKVSNENDPQLVDKGLGLFMPINGNNKLTAYCDSDWGSYVESRKSVTRYLVKFGEALISWKSKKQNIVSRSSTEAEFKSMATIVAEVTWLTGPYKELGVTVTLPFQMFCDSKAAIQIATHPIFHKTSEKVM
ncbi:uncharacterized mitochondrial protein AtMg00810-like [Capsicum annuum]|uniref:uncharacterized mitochondrial protein AtMg00810-like n=1 Tax=Capsicum annuum TaxID=4072 RepID=UPI001FB0DC25|nr:uncharacterized mitochondrial protein AtMg00810-like [Capsicum annuum]